MACLFRDRPEYGNTKLFDFATNGNGDNLPFYHHIYTTCQLIPHRHSYIQMVYIRRGSLTHVCGSHINDLRCGDLLLIPPYLPHYFIPIEGHEFELVEFEFLSEFIDSALVPGVPYDGCDALDWLEEYTSGHSFPLVTLSGQARFDAESLYAHIEREYTERAEGFEAAVRGCTWLLLTALRRAVHAARGGAADDEALRFERHREVLLRSLDFIRDNFRRDITVQDAAAVAIMSPSYYRHYFKLLTKKTFTEYLNGLRVAYAISLIQDSPAMKIADICYAAGFSNISHFNRTFLRMTGVTPKAFRLSASAAGQEDLHYGI